MTWREHAGKKILYNRHINRRDQANSEGKTSEVVVVLVVVLVRISVVQYYCDGSKIEIIAMTQNGKNTHVALLTLLLLPLVTSVHLVT